MVKDFFSMLDMISYIVGIDQDIIKIYYYTDIKDIEKDVIYKVLISKTKGYERLFKGSIASAEYGFLFIAFNNVN